MAPHLWKAALKLHVPKSWDREDVLQIGLMKALEVAKTFDPSRGHSFGAYALTAARRAMVDAVAENQGPVRIPAGSQDYKGQSCNAKEAARAQLRPVYLDAPVLFDAKQERNNLDVGYYGTSVSYDYEAMIDAKRGMEPLPPVAKRPRQRNSGRRVTQDGRPQSGVQGVRWHVRTGKWQAYMHIDGKMKHIGLFHDLHAAIAARREYEAAQ